MRFNKFGPVHLRTPKWRFGAQVVFSLTLIWVDTWLACVPGLTAVAHPPKAETAITRIIGETLNFMSLPKFCLRRQNARQSQQQQPFAD